MQTRHEPGSYGTRRFVRKQDSIEKGKPLPLLLALLLVPLPVLVRDVREGYREG